METCLILNQDYTPLAVCSWKKAIILVMLDKAWLVKEYRNHPVIDTQGREHVRPAVVQLPKYVKRSNRKVTFSKRSIFLRDKYRCAYCGSRAGHEVKFEDLNIDHIDPKFNGGKSSWENCITSCRSCNHRKANRTPKQAGMDLIFHPYQPSYQHLPVVSEYTQNFPDEWEEYIVG
jgi:5-methylcytosine-specific restriction endonuclease McrA